MLQPRIYPPTWLKAFEDGVSEPNLGRVLHSAQVWIDEEDPDMKEFESMVAEELWGRTLKRGGISLDRVILLLRLDQRMRQKEYLEKAEITSNHISRYESGLVPPGPHELTQFIKASRLSPDGLPAQMIRLLSEGRPPMDGVELQKCTFGELYLYRRQTMGETQREIAKRARVSQATISNLENKGITPLDATKRKLLVSMNLDPESALAEVAWLKAFKPDDPIPAALIDKVMTSDHDRLYLFAERMEEFGEHPEFMAIELVRMLRAKQAELRKSGATEAEVFGGLLRSARERQGMSAEDVATVTEIDESNLLRTERGERGIPIDSTYAEILYGIGIDVHSPAFDFFVGAAA